MAREGEGVREGAQPRRTGRVTRPRSSGAQPQREPAARLPPHLQNQRRSAAREEGDLADRLLVVDGATQRLAGAGPNANHLRFEPPDGRRLA